MCLIDAGEDFIANPKTIASGFRAIHLTGTTMGPADELRLYVAEG